jgi:hypothetical protein
MDRRLLIYCGILSSLLYAAMNVFIAAQWPEYSSKTQTVSELFAVDAPTQGLWIPLGVVYTLLAAAFGVGVRMSSAGNRPLRIAGSLLIAYGIAGLGGPFFPMHLRAALAAGGGNWSDTMHISLTMLLVLLMMIAMGFGAFAFGKGFRIYSILSMLVLVTFGILTMREAPGIDVNGPTPWIGVYERVNIGVFLLWVVVLAIVLLRGRNDPLTSGTDHGAA